jgi:ribose/xylose/arabinose/galactoside ABC-type transport system permease subunit
LGISIVKRFINQQKVWLVCILICVITPILKASFISSVNIWGVLMAMPTFGMAALGLTFILICGELDISIGSVMAFSGVTFALLVKSMPLFISLLITLVLCAIIGSIGGFLVSVCKLDSFVVSLSVMTSIKGIALALSDQKPIVISNATLSFIGETTFGPIPLIFIVFFALVFLAHYVLTKTQFGRNIFAVGGNREVAQSIGISVRFYKFIIFVISSVAAGLGGFMLLCRMYSGSPIVGEDAPLQVLPMVIIGGTSLVGGKGGAVKTLSGIILMSVVFNVMSLFNISINIQSFVRGAILLTIVVFNKYYANKDKKI